MTHHLDLATITLGKGSHDTREAGMCVMEATAYFAGERHSDHPTCVSPAIGAFLRTWNDALPDDERQLLVPYIPLVVGTRTTAADEQARAWLATDWLVRTFAPAWLRLAGLTDHADALAGLEALTSAALASKAQPIINAAVAAAWDTGVAAAGDAARAAAWDAARAAAWDAARAAAWDDARAAAGAAAVAAAWAAARAAARAAAVAAAGAALMPTVVVLQASARELLDRMIAVGRVEVASSRAQSTPSMVQVSTPPSTLTGSDLRLMRQARRIPQVAVARAAGWSQSRVRNVENTPRLTPTATARYLAALAAASGER